VKKAEKKTGAYAMDQFWTKLKLEKFQI